MMEELLSSSEGGTILINLSVLNVEKVDIKVMPVLKICLEHMNLQKKKERKKIPEPEVEIEEIQESEDDGEDPALDSLSQSITFQKAKTEKQNKKMETQFMWSLNIG
ncbi:hypothetical protein TREES_T100015931 [Tupaia chinensis]|uniref:Uncharacterized protein n=1 Tax=Tupaia chinensis TaxID=246437 RepID=L9KTD3_TUPCH|nr:hypothetical protein TREES_T100015931 [Tupaia chinensis]